MSDPRTVPPCPVVLLGPQRLRPTVGAVLAARIDRQQDDRQQDDGPQLPVAVVSAGWEERESEHLEFREHIGRPVENLALFRRVEDLFANDPELHAAARQLNDRLRELQKLYQIRLRHLVPATDELLRRHDATPELIEPEIAAAFESLRALDTHQLGRVGELRAEFRQAVGLEQRDGVLRHRSELAEVLSRSAALCIAGGHVGILFNRLWLFDVLDLVPASMPIVAWSAGAMVLAERIVLFHDSPPQGQGHAEVWGPGFAVCRGIVPLPHATARLRLEDPIRVQLLARRFPDHLCTALEDGSTMAWDGRRWVAEAKTMQLTTSGELAVI